MSCKNQNIVATVFDKKGRVLSVGKNSYDKTHPFQASLAEECGFPERKFLHAEIDALIRCRGTPYRIKVERFRKNGKLGLAKPCPICELAIKRAKIKFVEYSV
jgi:deoxycytidylate deaminase